MKSFKGKKALVTGHTGFKGSWLSTWLSKLGATVTGVSDRVPTEPSHYELVKQCLFKDLRMNLSDGHGVMELLKAERPDFIFHLAAQPIVLESYEDPLGTIQTNCMGTANVLEGLRKTDFPCVVVLVTSDKSYDNLERREGYKEDDRLGGKDPYSGSKGATELIIRCYFESFFNSLDCRIKLGVGRAGNVIGGGDWAPSRIVPDCVRAWAEGSVPQIRSPFSTRPWQHVLEPLGGYLSLARKLSYSPATSGEAFNFGPFEKDDRTVSDLIWEMLKHWPGKDWEDVSSQETGPYEANLLKLDCEKAQKHLEWRSTLGFDETAEWTCQWYRTFYEEGSDRAFDLTSEQIEQYMILSEERCSMPSFSNG